MSYMITKLGGGGILILNYRRSYSKVETKQFLVCSHSIPIMGWLLIFTASLLLPWNDAALSKVIRNKENINKRFLKYEDEQLESTDQSQKSILQEDKNILTDAKEGIVFSCSTPFF